VTLNQALATINSRKGRGEIKIHYLVCGFEPLHLVPLFRAHLMEGLPDADVEVRTGLYGDFRGNLELAASSPAIAAAVVLEWSDLDPRLGLRAAGGWSDDAKADILASIPHRYADFESAIAKLAARMPVALAPPSLPLPPIGHTILAQSSIMELELEQQLASFLSRVARLPGVKLMQQRFPSDTRLDARMELLAGFPYTLPFASELARSLAEVLWQPTPKKGLITDLDDTLWAGIVGEVGIDGISWHQESHTQLHGLYQQMLGHLAGCGVLVAAASKNEMTLVEAALARNDMLIDPDALFPVYANWGPKSASVARILEAWNIAPDAVVFVDDSPMELYEVGRAFPGITFLQFYGKDPGKIWDLLGQLRDLFGKPVVLEEDRLRQASLRSSSGTAPEFLSELEGEVSFEWNADSSDKRPLELINKTNQFNLNGLRLGEGEWQRLIENADTLCGVVSYKDKFGSLGRIAVVVGAKIAENLRISHWVMSCRAFSRRIEYHTLHALFCVSNAEEIEFAFQSTERNQPLREFFAAAGICPDPGGKYRLSRTEFTQPRPAPPVPESAPPEPD
jgi:FkbH-like protein